MTILWLQRFAPEANLNLPRVCDDWRRSGVRSIVKDSWLSSHATYRDTVAAHLGFSTATQVNARRIESAGLIGAFTDIIFRTESMPLYHAPSGGVLSDGTTVVMTCYDISRGKVQAVPEGMAGHHFREIYESAFGGTALFNIASMTTVPFGAHFIINNHRLNRWANNLTLQDYKPTYAALRADRLSDANARALRTGRVFCPGPLAPPRTVNGLPVTLPLLTAENAEELVEKVKNDLGLTSEDIANVNFTLGGDDPGHRFAHAIELTITDLNGQRRCRSLAMSPKGRQTLLNNHNRRVQGLRRDAALTSESSLQDTVLFDLSPASANERWLLRQRQGQLMDRGIAQVIRTAGFHGLSSHTVPKPMLFAFGNDCKPARGSHTGDFRNSFIRKLVRVCETRRLPSRFFLVNEAWSSQTCLDPNCRTERGTRSGYVLTHTI